MRRFFRFAGLVLFILSLAWALIAHARFILTLDGNVTEPWIAPLRGTTAIKPAVLAIIFQYFVSGLGFGVGAVLLRKFFRSPALYCFLVGLLFSLWSSTQFLVVEYCGVYTNLPGAIVGSIASGSAGVGPSYFVPATIVNLAIGPIVGWLLGWLTPMGTWLLELGRNRREWQIDHTRDASP
jgi:hypothetical protein